MGRRLETSVSEKESQAARTQRYAAALSTIADVNKLLDLLVDGLRGMDGGGEVTDREIALVEGCLVRVRRVVNVVVPGSLFDDARRVAEELRSQSAFSRAVCAATWVAELRGAEMIATLLQTLAAIEPPALPIPKKGLG